MEAEHKGTGEATPPEPPKPKHGGEWAAYLVCPVCRNIMSGKVKKLHYLGRLEDGQDAYCHKTCVPALRKIVANAVANKAAKPEEVESETGAAEAVV